MRHTQVAVNLNSLIKFRPTVEGRRIMSERNVGTLDKEGNACMLLWEAFNVFGPFMYGGTTTLPFVGNSLTILDVEYTMTTLGVETEISVG